MKYNYVIFWYDYWGLYEQSFSDLYDKPYARYIASPAQYQPNILKAFYKELQKHPRINRKISKIFADKWMLTNLWYPFHFRNDFHTHTHTHTRTGKI